MVAAHDRHVHVRDREAPPRRHERVGADHVQGRDAEQPPRVVRALLLQHLGGDRHHRVHRVADNVDQRARRVVRHRRHEVAHDARVDAEQVVPRHAGLPGHAGGEDHDVRARQAGRELVFTGEAGDLRGGVAVAQV